MGANSRTSLVKMLLSLVVFLGGCKYLHKDDSSQVSFSIDLPQAQLNENLAKNFVQKMLHVAKTKDAHGLTLADFLRLLPLTKDEIALINQKRPVPPVVICDDSFRCEVKQQGHLFDLKLANIDMGKWGKPTFEIASTVVLQFRALPSHSREQVLEFCQVSGVKVKKGLGAAVNGAKLIFDSAQAKGQRVKAMISAGPGGTYPHGSCRPVVH